MKKSNISSKNGFTIIEVVLVLAVAGLIFLMVFVAVPAMQRNQRDTQRRNDMARFFSQLSNYQANHNGKYPSGKAGYDEFITNYMEYQGETFIDPTTNKTYEIGFVKPASDSGGEEEKIGTIYIWTGARCEDQGVISIPGAGVNKIAIRTKLEGPDWYCQNN